MFMRHVWRDFCREITGLLSETRPSWGISFGLVILALLADPFTAISEFPTLQKVITWCLLVGGGAVLAILFRGCLRLIPRDISQGQETVLVSALLGMLYAPLIYLWLASLGMPPNPVYTTTLVVASALMVSSLRQAITETSPAPVPRRDRFYDRLPNVGDAHVIRLSSADHHVMVRLSDGQSLRLRMRLRDAVAEMDETRGFCVHRSHWVALRDIKGVQISGARERVVLYSGDTLPVGPKYRPNLVNAGFLPD
jgi:hypothetical protein